MKVRYIVFVLVALCLFGHTEDASCQQNARIRKAIEEFNAGHYATAVTKLKNSYQSARPEERAELIFMVGLCYRRTNLPALAEQWFNLAISRGFQDPIVHLYLGDAKRMRENWAEAREEYTKFIERAPNDPRGQNGIRSIDFAIAAKEAESSYEVTNARFFNAPRLSDFGPVFASDDYSVVYFTSSRDAATGKDINSVTGEKFTDIFVSRQDRRGAWSQPVPIEGDVNTEFDEAVGSFSPDYQTMYFTRCQTHPNKSYGCQILAAQLVNGRWTRERVIEISHDTIIVAHPAISPDEMTLYFVSDMNGGQGGKDIWKVTRNNISDNWGRPVNLGSEINTSGDEMFPWVHPDGTLYFSSDGHIGLGGLDIFKAKEENGRWTVENMGAPINSASDDFGITFKAETEEGFFTTSRDNTSRNRSVDNIFAFSLPPLSLTLTGIVIDEKTQAPLSNTAVTVLTSDGITDEVQTSADGTFRLTLRPNIDYVFIARRDNYLNGRERESTRGIERNRTFNITIPLTSIAEPIEIPNIMYDFGRWELRPESMVFLDMLVQTLNDNPDITIEIGSHTDSRGSEELNLTLSQRRAQSVVDYLIEKGISSNRVSARGYGKSLPKVVDAQMATQHTFLRAGMALTDDYINSIVDPNEQEIAHGFNRRTDFRVIRTE